VGQEGSALVAWLRSEHIRTEAGFAALRREWNDLLDRSPSRSVFLTWEWLHAWWQCVGRERPLLVIAVRDGRGQLVGVGPFCVARTGCLNPLRTVVFLGTEQVCSEYLDIVADPGLIPEVVECIWAALRQEMHAWDCLRFTDLLENAVVRQRLVPLARQGDFLVLEGKGHICPYFPLGAGRKGFWSALGPNQRANLRRRTRSFVELGATHEVTDSMDRLPEALATLFDLHAKRWAEGRQRSTFDGERIHRFHREVVESLGLKGRVRIHTLRLNGKVVASLYALEYKKHVFYYQSGFDPALPDSQMKENHYTPGFVLMGRVLEDAAGRGLEEFDFLRGPETYKSRWTDACRVTRSVTIAPQQHWNAVLQIGIERAVATVKKGLKTLLRREKELL
jgi:CelD/BcsL family acetyltransferase involved in cellulose biosynthesis